MLLWMVTANKKLSSYCSIQKSGYWLVYKILDHKSKTSFFRDMRSLQNVRKPLVRSYSNKKVHMNELDFCQNPKNLIFERFLWLFVSFVLAETFFQKWASSIFFIFGPSNFIQFRDLTLQTGERTEPNWLDTFPNADVQQVS